jgi:dolichol-phosphate mannosyltransferase
VARYWELLNQGWDAVFGSRFVKGGGEIDYPWLKLRLNRVAHAFIMLVFGIKTRTIRPMPAKLYLAGEVFQPR